MEEYKEQNVLKKPTTIETPVRDSFHTIQGLHFFTEASLFGREAPYYGALSNKPVTKLLIPYQNNDKS